MDMPSVRQRLVEAVAAAIEVCPSDINPSATFDAMGFDSLSKTGLVPKVERLFGCVLDPEVVFDYPTVELLADHIAVALSSGNDLQIKISREHRQLR